MNTIIKKGISALLAGSALFLASCGGRLPTGVSTGASSQAIILVPTRNAFYVFDLLTNRVRSRINTGMVPNDLALGSGGLVFVSHAQENSFSVFHRGDANTWYGVGKVGTPDQPGRIVFSTPADELYVASAVAPRLGIYRMNGLKRPLLDKTLRLDADMGPPSAIALSPDGQNVFVAGDTVQSLTRANGTLTLGQTLTLPENTDIADMLVAGNNLLLADRNQDRLIVVDIPTFKQTASLELGKDLPNPVIPARMVLNNAGTKVYITGSGASVVQVIDAKEPKILQTLALDGSDVRFPADVPFGIDVTNDDSQVYVTAQSGRNLALLDVNPGIDQSDVINRTFGTASSEALLPPLGDIQIF